MGVEKVRTYAFGVFAPLIKPYKLCSPSEGHCVHTASNAVNKSIHFLCR